MLLQVIQQDLGLIQYFWIGQALIHPYFLIKMAKYISQEPMQLVAKKQEYIKLKWIYRQENYYPHVNSFGKGQAVSHLKAHIYTE
ncbi:hypothetical protein D3C77_547030 [compost metagenome]